MLPVKAISIKRAVCLIFTDKALVIEPSYQTYTFNEWVIHTKYLENRECLRSPSIKIAIPIAIVLKASVSRKMVFKLSRENIFRRDNFQCRYCGKKLIKRELTCDHIVPRSQGGKKTWKNIVTACKSCNNKKGDRTPEEANMILQKRNAGIRSITLLDLAPSESAKEGWRAFFREE